MNGNDTDHILFYNTAKVDLIAQNYIPTSLREFGEYTLSVDGTEFNVYSAHLKASSGSSNEQRRLGEVTVLREHLETLPADMAFIVAGDMNIYGSSEPAYQKLVANESNNAGRLEDFLPAEMIGEWHNNSAFASVHTQSPRTTSFGGGATGGMDDRFDMIFGNFGINDGFGIEYVADSYFALGNDGLHFNTSILDGTNNSASPAVIQAIHDASDHLPVVADFQVITAGGSGVTLVETEGNTSASEGGATDTYQIFLDSIPTSNVLISVTPDGQIDIGNGVGNPITLTFTPNNALTPQTINVSAWDDAVIEGAHAGIIQHSVSSNDTDYDGFNLADVTVSIADNDAASTSFLFNEVYVNNPGGDGNHEFIEILATPSTPLSDVWLLEIEGDGSNAGVIDNAQNLSTLVSGSNGLVLLGQNYASNGTPWGSEVDAATTLANLSGGTMENGSITFILVEGFAGSVGEDIDNNNDGQVDVSLWTTIYDSVGWLDGGSSDRVYSSASLTQSGVPDAATRITDDERAETFDVWFNGDINGSTDSTTYGNGSSNLPDGAVITPGSSNFGDSGPNRGVTIVQSGGSTVITEGGGSDSWTVVLDSVPTTNVLVTIQPDLQVDIGAGAGTSIQLVFTPSNALTSQTVTAHAVDDLVSEGEHVGLITHTVNSSDTDYDGLSASNVIASISDNDTAGITLIQTNGSTNVTEGGATDTYTVVLDSIPTSDVSVFIDPDGQASVGAGAGNSVSLTFTPTNALIPQTVTVTANDDSFIEGQHSSTITHLASSSDGFYDGLNPGFVVATVTDNDFVSPGITITQSGDATSVSEAGLNDSYTIVLDSVPSANVSLAVNPGNQLDLGNGAGVSVTLVFTPTNAFTPQTVDVAAVDDALVEGDHSDQVYYLATSSDSDYEGFSLSNTNVTITDNDAAGVVIAQSSGSTDVSEGGNNDSYSLALESQPTLNVTVTVTPDSQIDLGAGAGNPIQVQFTPANALTPQTISVIAFDDNAIEGSHTGLITHEVTSADLNYDSLSVQSVTANITDNDSPGSSTKFFIVDQSADDTFEYEADGTLADNYSLNSGNRTPRGVATNAEGTKVWVLDSGNDRVYVYDADGNSLGDWGVSGLDRPEGIATDGTNIWIVDRRVDRVMYFEGATSFLSGTHSETSSFGLISGGRNPHGLTTDGNSIWVAHAARSVDRAYKYSVSGEYQGHWNLDSKNVSPSGLTIDPNNVDDIWVVDRSTDQVFHYFGAASRTSGSQNADIVWDLASGNSNPRGIADPLVTGANLDPKVGSPEQVNINVMLPIEPDEVQYEPREPITAVQTTLRLPQWSQAQLTGWRLVESEMEKEDWDAVFESLDVDSNLGIDLEEAGTTLLANDLALRPTV